MYPVPSLAAPRAMRTLMLKYWAAMMLPTYDRPFQVADILRAKLYDTYVSNGTLQPPTNAQGVQQIQKKA